MPRRRGRDAWLRTTGVEGDALAHGSDTPEARSLTPETEVHVPLYWDPFDRAAPPASPEPWGGIRTIVTCFLVWLVLAAVGVAPWLLLAWILNQ